jgi:short-subunit dehydrogenase
MERRPLALVTGASSGIGEAIARALFARGDDLIVVARGSERLEHVATELGGTRPGGVEVVEADLTLATGIDRVEEVIGTRGPDTVVNCAGSGWHGPFAEQERSSLEELLALDVCALALLSRAALSTMVPRGSGGLLNVSSTASFVPGPTVAAYHASKAFVTSLTEALHVEATGTGVHVTALCPGITPTRFQARAGTEHAHLPKLLTTSADRVAREGVAALERNDALCVPGRANQLIAVCAKLAPRPVVRRAARAFLARV